jgi:hypothetical protein
VALTIKLSVSLSSTHSLCIDTPFVAPEQRFLHQPPKKSGLSIEDKKKLLWGDKKVAGTNWNATEFGDSTEKDKFLRLMGAKKEV